MARISTASSLRRQWAPAAERGARISAPAVAKPVNAKDRIGAGPWQNVKGVVVATSVADLHSDTNKLSKENSLTEKGAVVNGRGDTPNTHDILTGSNLDGTLAGDDLTCNDWTSSAEGSAQVGHHDRQGGGTNPTSWNSAHPSRAAARKTSSQPAAPGCSTASPRSNSCCRSRLAAGCSKAFRSQPVYRI